MSSFKVAILYSLIGVTFIWAKDVMITSFPSSGSSWFFRIIKNNSSFSDQCFGEFFNFLGTGGPGTTPQLARDIFLPLNQKNLQNALEKWKAKNGYLTKEIHAYAKLENYQDYFNIVCLYRHRKYTFPSGAVGWILPIYQGFIDNDYQDSILQKLKNYCINHVKTDIEKQVAIHTIAWYLTFKAVQKYHFPIIEYEKLLRLPEKKLSQYLQERLPGKLFSKQLVEAICQKRRTGESYFFDCGRWQGIKYLFNYYIKGQHWIDMRAGRYGALGVESFCQKLIAYMKTLDKDFKYWDLLD